MTNCLKIMVLRRIKDMKYDVDFMRRGVIEISYSNKIKPEIEDSKMQYYSQNNRM